MPTKDGVGRDERGNFGEGASANGLTSHGQSAALIVGQPESTATDLLFQDSILLAEVLDDRVLLTSDPAGHGGDEDLPRLKDDDHPEIVAQTVSIGQLSSDVEVGYSPQNSVRPSKRTVRLRPYRDGTGRRARGYFLPFRNSPTNVLRTR